MSQSSYTDSEIIEGLINGDEKVARYFYKRFFRYARSAIYSERKSLSLANDLFNDAFIALMKNIKRDNFRLEGALSTYMYTIFIRQSRKNERAYRETEDLNEDLYSVKKEQDYDRAHDAGVFREILNKKMEQLKEKCKEILKMVWKGFAYESIANELDISVKYVNRKKTDCRKELMRSFMNEPQYEIVKELFPGVIPEKNSENSTDSKSATQLNPDSGSGTESNSDAQ